MKRVILLSLILSAITVIPVFASIPVDQFTDAEFVINQGYSEVMAEDVFMLKNRAKGKPIETLYDVDANPLVRGWRGFWGYIDPALERHDRVHHDMKLNPSFSDL